MKLANDRIYYGYLYLGSRSISVPLMIDTGTEMLAVQTSDCSQEFDKLCNNASWYDVNMSNRYFKPTVAKFERTYYESQIWLRGSIVED